MFNRKCSKVNEVKRVRVDKNNPSIQRIEERCINCGMCMNTCENIVGIDHSYEKEDNALCINCGACIMHCPVGALTPKYDYKKVLNLLKDSNKILAVSIAPAVRVALSYEFGLKDGTNMEDIIPTICRHLGFKYVFDVTFGADVTIMEESKEFVQRLKDGEKLPLYTSCCPSWVKYASMFHPDILKNLSTAKSPIGMQSSLIKTYFKEFNDINEDIISVVITPCTSKKYEIQKEDTDYVLTVQEFAMMVRECRIDVKSLKPSNFDYMLSKGSKSAVMFGRSGGVMEAILNNAYHMITKKRPTDGMFHIDITEPITERRIKIGKYTINTVVIYGMNALNEFLENKIDADIIEVMNCNLGCIGGGGTPLIPIKNIQNSVEERKSALNSVDADVSFAYENENIKELYNTYINKLSEEDTKELLHTTHKSLRKLIKTE